MARRIVILIFLIALGNIGLVAQDIESANKLYEIHAFDAAIEMYEEVIEANPKNTIALANIADCYRRTNRMNDAFKWYGKAVSTGNAQPETFFQFGLTLKALGRYSEAEQWFKSYASVDADKGNYFATSCRFAEAQKTTTPAYTVTKELINSSAADFGAIFYKSGVAYSSSRADLGDNSTWLGSNISQMLFSTTNWKGAMKKPTVMHKGIKAKKDVGPATYSKDGQTVYYTVNNFEDGTRWLGYNGLVMSIEQATVETDGSWSGAKPLPFNTGGFSVAFPTLSDDGQTIYFASDRPDGFGGFDIYMSTKQGQSWSSPVNLGATVNTPGDEITPFIDGNILYFSSNWHTGIGGYDIFKVAKSGNNWQNVTNLGKDINSTRDDICFVYSRTKKYGYITSNRLGGKGDLDLYRVKKTGEISTNPPVTENPKPPGSNGNDGNSTFSGREEITLRVINAANLEGVPFALLDFSKCPNGGNPTTDAQGQYTFVATQAYDCAVTITKNDFTTKTINLRTINSPKRTIEIKLEPLYDGYAGFVYDVSSQNALANVLVTAKSLSTGEVLQVLSNNVGRYVLGLKPNNSYNITFSKAGYVNSAVEINTLDGTNYNILGQQVLYRSGTTDPNIIVDGGTTEPVVDEDRNGEDPAWAVQIGVFSTPNIDALAKLKVYGNVFREPKGNMMSYKVGTFTSKEEAICIRNCIKKETGMYQDAWVTPVRDDDIIRRTLIEEDVMESACCGGSSSSTTTTTTLPPKKPVVTNSTNDDIAPPGVTYKVQLGVYRELRWFPEEKFTDLGQLEIRPKQLASGESANVVLLGNFKSKAQAEAMKEKVRARGLPQAFVVSYKNGKPVK